MVGVRCDVNTWNKEVRSVASKFTSITSAHINCSVLFPLLAVYLSFVFLSVCLSVCLSVRLCSAVCPLISLSIILCCCTSLRLPGLSVCLCLSVRYGLSVRPSVCLSLSDLHGLSVSVCGCLLICVTVCLAVCYFWQPSLRMSFKGA